MKKLVTLIIAGLFLGTAHAQRISPSTAEFDNLERATALDPNDDIIIFPDSESGELEDYDGKKPFALKASLLGVGAPADWSTLLNIPADIADGDDDTIYTFTLADLQALAPDVDLDTTDDVNVGGTVGQVPVSDGIGGYSWGLPVDNDTIYNDTALTNAINTHITADLDTDPQNEIELPAGAVEGQILGVDVNGDPVWETPVNAVDNIDVLVADGSDGLEGIKEIVSPQAGDISISKGGISPGDGKEGLYESDGTNWIERNYKTDVVYMQDTSGVAEVLTFLPPDTCDYAIEFSADLIGWSFVQPNGATNNADGTISVNVPANAAGYYRVRETDLGNLVSPSAPLNQERMDNPDLVKPRIVFFGDSLTDSTVFNIERVPEILEWGNVSKRGFDYVPLTSNDEIRDRTLWPTKGIHNLSVSNDVVTANNAGALEFDSFTVYYLAEAGAGTFDIGVQTFTLPITQVVYDTVNADNGGARSLESVTITVPKGLYRGKIYHNAGGDVKIITTSLGRSYNSGPEVYQVTEGGKDIPDWNQVEPYIIHGILKEIKPHYVYHKTADSLPSVDLLQSTLIDVWNTFTSDPLEVPEWVLITRNPWGDDNEYFKQIQMSQANLLKDVAVKNGHSFINTKDLYGSDPERMGLTGAGDDVHPTRLGYVRESSYVFNLLDFIGSANTSYNTDTTNDFGIVTNSTYKSLFNRSLSQVVNITLDGEHSSTATKVITDDKGIFVQGTPPDGASGRVTLSDEFHRTAFSGTRFDQPFGFTVTLSGHVFEVNNTYRVMAGVSESDYDLNNSGFGLEIKSTGAYLIAHDGTGKSISVDALPGLGDRYSTYSVWLGGDGKVYGSGNRVNFNVNNNQAGSIVLSNNVPNASSSSSGNDTLSLTFEQEGAPAGGYDGKVFVEQVWAVNDINVFK